MEGVFVNITNGIPGPVQPVPKTYDLTGVDCVSATTCYAAGDDPYQLPPEPATQGGAVVTITNGDTASVVSMPVPNPGPGVAGFVSLFGIGCTSTTECVVVGESDVQGGFAASVKDGDPSTDLVSVGEPNSQPNGIECVPGNRCMLNINEEPTSGADRRLQAWNEVVMYGPHNSLVKGSDGILVNTTPYGGDCRPDDLDFCMIGGAGGPKGAHGDVDVAQGTSAHAVKVPGTSTLSDVSCAGSYWCAAVGWVTTGSESSAGVLVSLASETPRTAVQVPQTTQLTAVSCISSGLCVTVGQGVIDSFRVENG